jgi:hypothetical protein
VLGEADRRGLTPLFTSNMIPYGEVSLRIDRRLDLTTPQSDDSPEHPGGQA